jgi:gamma-glutamylcyclotransferase (GGCT)/AIG2-like uncharacterized protein YtfP
MREQLFVYGTLRDPAVQQAVFGRVVEGIPDTLDGYARTQIVLGGTEYAIIRPDNQQSIEGLLIEVNPQELTLIDRYEGDAYQRVRVTLKSRKTAWVYQAPG